MWSTHTSKSNSTFGTFKLCVYDQKLVMLLTPVWIFILHLPFFWLDQLENSNWVLFPSPRLSPSLKRKPIITILATTFVCVSGFVSTTSFSTRFGRKRVTKSGSRTCPLDALNILDRWAESYVKSPSVKSPNEKSPKLKTGPERLLQV